MVSAREIMHNDVAVVGAAESLVGAAQKMRDLHIGALPVLDGNEELLGIITDRDIVVRCVAEGHDPLATIAQELVHTEPIWVYADSDIVDVLDTMEQNKVRRVPVMEDDRLVGIISEANVATNLEPAQVDDFAAAVYSAPPNN
jgi:CBS domain-containing protein